MEVEQRVGFLDFHQLSACLAISACSEETVEIFLSTRYVEEKIHFLLLVFVSFDVRVFLAKTKVYLTCVSSER